jgi:type IV pilus assembly protein PilV
MKQVTQRLQSGFSMIEVLVSLIIILVALLGIAALQGRAQIAELEAQQRAMALVLLSDITDRMIANNQTLSCFAVTTNSTSGTPFIGVGTTSEGHATLSGCAASISTYNALADTAIAEIDDLLEGAAETAGGTNVGGMIGARACISYDSGTELTGLPGTGLYTVAVSWQGMADLVTPAVNCAVGLYGTEAKRRTVSTSFRMADLL